MNLILHPRPLSGRIAAIPSKSWAHRLLLGAALSGTPTTLPCSSLSEDVEATCACLSATGVSVTYRDGILAVQPGMGPGLCRLPCGQSGTTFRFLLSVAAALGISADFYLDGRLPLRPLAPLDRELETHGVVLFRPEPGLLQCRGRLQPGAFSLPGNVSSQLISGLLFALPLLDGESTLTVTGPVESGPYLEMTQAALALFGIHIPFDGTSYFISPTPYQSPGQVQLEGDWSNAAFWLCGGALGGGITVSGLRRDSLQGDRTIGPLLAKLGAHVSWDQDRCTSGPGRLRPIWVDARPIPDLVPILAVAAAAAPGESRIAHAGRLRLKESDRLDTTCRLLQNLGSSIRLEGDCLVIQGGAPLTGGAVESFGDHRIAMAAAVAASLCRGPVQLSGAEAVTKSYPRFWQGYRSLGGSWEETP